MFDDAADNRAIGRALRALRVRARVTQEALAHGVGTTASYLSQLENGHRGVRWHTIMRILRALDASVAELAAEVEGSGPGTKRRSRTVTARNPRKGRASGRE